MTHVNLPMVVIGALLIGLAIIRAQRDADAVQVMREEVRK